LSASLFLTGEKLPTSRAAQLSLQDGSLDKQRCDPTEGAHCLFAVATMAKMSTFVLFDKRRGDWGARFQLPN